MDRQSNKNNDKYERQENFFFAVTKTRQKDEILFLIHYIERKVSV